jgi:hypothetical protein
MPAPEFHRCFRATLGLPIPVGMDLLLTPGESCFVAIERQ